MSNSSEDVMSDGTEKRRLSEIAKRAEAATPGPWKWRGKSGSLHGPGTPPYEFGGCVLSPTYEYDSGVDIEVSDEDSAFIINARQDIPYLLAELEALKHDISRHVQITSDQAEEIERLRAAIGQCEGACGHELNRLEHGE